MRIATGALLLSSLAILQGCAHQKPPFAPHTTDRVEAIAIIRNPSGAEIGQARILRYNEHTRIHVQATTLTPGEHGMHLHTTGACIAPDFASAGGHLNPTSHEHGHDNPQGSHLGDLPNIMADNTGKASGSTPLHGDWETIQNHIFDQNGTAIVIHAGPDDYRTDPAGNSGSRVACGTFIQR